MATLQQLEKLYQIRKIFSVEDSLESAVAGDRIQSLIKKTEHLMRQRAFLREERRNLRIATERLEERQKALQTMQRPDWIPSQLKLKPEKHLRVNIAGLMFEAPISVFSRDPKSLLTQLCSASPPLTPDEDGVFYFDRDWWLFRHVMIFLRDGVLPDDRPLLSQLYREAAFWQLNEMQLAIEEQKLHLRHELPKDAKKPPDAWWRKLPNWWQTVDEQKEKEAATKKKKEEDWWTGQKYKGKTFEIEKEKFFESDKNEKERVSKTKTNNTWSTFRQPPPVNEDYGGIAYPSTQPGAGSNIMYTFHVYK